MITASEIGLTFIALSNGGWTNGSVEGHANRLGGGFQLVIEGCQRQTTPHGQFQVGGVIGRKIVIAGKAQGISERMGLGFVIDSDGQRG